MFDFDLFGGFLFLSENIFVGQKQIDTLSACFVFHAHGFGRSCLGIATVIRFCTLAAFHSIRRP
jgi:hypothetical protein